MLMLIYNILTATTEFLFSTVSHVNIITCTCTYSIIPTFLARLKYFRFEIKFDFFANNKTFYAISFCFENS